MTAHSGARRPARSLLQIVPSVGDEARRRDLEEAWASFCREMDAAVQAALDASRTPPEIAYAVGEIVHNYFRARGVTLTSQELRCIVAELVAPPTPTPEPDELTAMVSFASLAAGSSPWTGGEAADAGPARVEVSIPSARSPLVERLEPHEAGVDRLLPRVVAAALQTVDGLSRAAALSALRGIVDAETSAEAGEWPSEARERLALMALSEVSGLGLIDRLWSDRSIQAVYVNGPKAVFVERAGILTPAAETFSDEAHLMRLLVRLARGVREGVVEIRLRDGGGGTIVFPPAAPAGPVAVIRRGDPAGATFARLIASELIDRRSADVLRIAARSHLKIAVSGPRGSGRTALLVALARDLGDLRVVTVAGHRSFRYRSPTKVELAATAGGPASLVETARRLRPDVLVLDGVPSRALPEGGTAIVAALDDAERWPADLTIRLGRATDGLYRVLGLQDASGVDLRTGQIGRPSFADAVEAAGYGAAWSRLFA